MKSKTVMLLPRKCAGGRLKLLADVIYIYIYIYIQYLLSGRKIERKNQKKQKEEKQRNVVYGVNIKMLVWPLEVGCILIATSLFCWWKKGEIVIQDPANPEHWLQHRSLGYLLHQHCSNVVKNLKQ